MKQSNMDPKEVPEKERDWDEGKVPENREMRMFRFRNYNEPQTREVKPSILLDTPQRNCRTPKTERLCERNQRVKTKTHSSWEFHGRSCADHVSVSVPGTHVLGAETPSCGNSECGKRGGGPWQGLGSRMTSKTGKGLAFAIKRCEELMRHVNILLTKKHFPEDCFAVTVCGTETILELFVPKSKLLFFCFVLFPFVSFFLFFLLLFLFHLLLLLLLF